MALDIQWDHQFCLSCDRQTDGATYCSESCRLADYEKTSSPSSSTPSSGASSPALAGPSYPWGFSSTPSSYSSPPALYLAPAYDFSTQRHSTYPARTSTSSSCQPAATNARILSPSSSHASLSSMGSNPAKGTEAFHLSDKSKRELQAYASSFEQVRLQRRRSQ